MKIPKAILVDPQRNQLYGCAAVALSIFVFAYSTRFGQVSILAYYACWLPLLLVDHRRILDGYWHYLWVIAFAVLACLSVFWSAAPSVTARASVQLLSHVICALIAARTVNTRTLTLGAMLGICVVLMFSFAFGQYSYDPLDGNYSFVGAFSSKNQIGLFSSLGILFAFAALVILRERGLWRMLALACAVLSAVALVKAQSATSVLAIIATLAVLICLKITTWFSPTARKGALIAGLMVALVAVFAAASLGACSKNAQDQSLEAANAVGADVSATASNAVGDVQAATDQALNGASAAMDNAGDAVKNKADKAGDTIKHGAEKARDAAGGALKDAGNAIQNH